MKHQILAVVAFSPLIAYALPKSYDCGRPVQCAKSSSTTTVVQTYSQAPTSAVSVPTSQAEAQTTSETLGDLTTYPAIPIESFLTTSTLDGETAVTSTTASPVSSTSEATQVAADAYSQATQVSYKVAATEQCGNNDVLALPGMPWVVANSMYNAGQMVGSQCTNFAGVLQATDGTKEVQWNSITDIAFVDSTRDLCKGYTNIGVGVNLNKRLNAITSIPAYFQWDRTNTTAFRGSNLFDFITAPTTGDTTSTATSEFMLWIRNWGNQVPIGYADGPVATLNLFGASWKLYEGKNPNNGVVVRSMLADQDFESEFQGNLKEWLDIMVQKGYISDSEYVTAGNAGTEVFYGSATMSATVALNINV
ncbi:concanavalin A-like lectin/glucanase domain-containing protein [Truncatella angustata]|uniref:Concanavalin A-like lectin/glucanase domain-containing protein n=1 Tax=Truncatella angustata TaxID=152316 RepID=A0A9P8UYZ4_9PEZI|nr:concanavalin A-like lectin/glucanase domain-containing protein [Truncatella angustata]KAH6660985.1 concanavalin A-like lectin/glucanase domain-containing protein [Truncatella angustata]KAH8203698.1 hypothetical protein TruAng_002111 [Truncatella angustata]